ncbi:MAG: penicillin acylase family protein [Prolixibacteraceae bacterium]|jgi:penicillin G amidase|nr:penicillin acylase family protein [Prolixibacteraceae bacterium]MBT6004292.1 penicillin acylase family protein [Prolixibacteraceae bacterium]MBT7397339.1 penicillin acylase family protein [Prolixibacteraceae bacterium]
MKVFKQILTGLFILLTLLIFIGFFLLNNLRNGAVPDYNKNHRISGLTEEVTVLRDSFGVPHIIAENDADLYRSVGFTMAQDRLWQMDLLRRVTQGRLSEILGKEQVNTDLLMRSLRIQEKSEKIFAGAQPEIVEALEAFSDGLNQYIENYPLPPEFKVLAYKPEPWKPVHSINLIGYMSWDLTSGWGTEMTLHEMGKEIDMEQLLDLIPDLEKHNTASFPDFNLSIVNLDETILSANRELEKLGIEVFSGSNNWAISGKKSKTGKPLMANDMHLGLFAPGIWYQMHQVVEGKLNVTGLVLPGQPFVIAGHNDSIGWGMTNVMVDDLDFYAETLNKDSTKYLLDGEWKDLLVKNVSIKTKEGDELSETLKFTHRGPIVNRFKNEKEIPLSIHWLGNEMSNEMRSVYLLNRAKNWTDFKDALKTFKAVSQNVVYADVAGNIGLQTCAGVPMRAGSGIQIYPGDTSKYDWTGLVPFEELPFEFNPERGYVSSANNKTVPADYPHYISHWFAVPDRINRIREILDEKEKLGIEDFQEMHKDVTSMQAKKFVPGFLAALTSETNWDGTQSAALQKLKSWDFALTRDSQAASVYEILYRKTCENLIKDDLSTGLFKALKGERMLLENLMINVLANETSEWIDDKNTPEIETFDMIVVRSFKETVSDLSAELGPNIDDWSWGKIHTFTLNHPLGVVSTLDKILNLNKGPFEVPGSYHTVCPYSYSYNNLYKVNHGASHRHIFDVNNWDASKTIIPTGTSGIPASDYYLDQTGLYINNQYHADPFSWEEVQKMAKFETKLYTK